MADFRAKVQANLDTLRQHPEQLEHQKIDNLVKLYRELRDWRSEIKKEADKEMERIKDVMDTAEGYLLSQLEALGVESARTPDGTVFRTMKVGVRVADWPVFLDWAKEHDLFALLGHYASKADVLRYIEESEETPPGIDVYRERIIQVRKQ